MFITPVELQKREKRQRKKILQAVREGLEKFYLDLVDEGLDKNRAYELNEMVRASINVKIEEVIRRKRRKDARYVDTASLPFDEGDKTIVWLYTEDGRTLSIRVKMEDRETQWNLRYLPKALRGMPAGEWKRAVVVKELIKGWGKSKRKKVGRLRLIEWL